ncbi:MAG TPA: phosphate butyryltransferase [Clostridiaceae bacterium]|jgi:phosphate butyryltransferase|nr:phosphate butyryltransferase [Clostridiaceae bacterium]HBF76476.1 phosphate butyryltransferase [Clostridiaceae bacterium]HBG39576.1 phosphate butyryltransferase [Clostridiaceae bacterium]HBN27873.1 phosphate butyryltransferase [Clostridiaceae bacterium]HBX47506.1 phosphate butyryltransferase [Clostridiaceae bacterium]
MMKDFDAMMKMAKSGRKMRLSVAAAEDDEVLIAVDEGRKLGIIEATLVGDKSKIEKIARAASIDLNCYEIVDVKSKLEAVRTAVSLVSSGKADFLMKGQVPTADLLRAVLDKEIGLRGGGLLSHVMVYSVPTYHKLLFLTDGGMVTNPDLTQKVQIINNAVKVTKALGINSPRVAPLCAVEVVNPDMQATLDAAALTKMCERGQIRDCIIDGPLALDNAVSKEAAKRKGIDSPVAGEADILLVPNIEAGNLLGKSLTYFAMAKSAGVIMGAKCPIVLVSRADTHESKLYSIALGSIVANLK